MNIRTAGGLAVKLARVNPFWAERGAILGSVVLDEFQPPVLALWHANGVFSAAEPHHNLIFARADHTKVSWEEFLAMNSQPRGKTYGCYNRAPLPAKWNAPDQCQYTLSKLGMTDPRCVGCKLKKDHHERTV